MGTTVTTQIYLARGSWHSNRATLNSSIVHQEEKLEDNPRLSRVFSVELNYSRTRLSSQFVKMAWRARATSANHRQSSKVEFIVEKASRAKMIS